MNANPWGRADEHGTVSVREGDTWREVGQFPDATPDEALAYFERKYADLEGQVRLLEQRIRGGANAADIAKVATHLKQSVVGASAVGDLQALEERLGRLEGKIDELTEQQKVENAAAAEAAIAERTGIVEQAEALAAQDPKSVQWKDTSARLDALFAQWQAHQKDGAKVPKGVANDLWKRFRTARSSIETARRAFFAGLDSQHKDAKTAKQALIERAVALAPKGTDGISAYRALLDEWKAAGRAGRKVDDALWADFKTAGDVLFQAKAEETAVENEEHTANLEAKQALLAEAEPILKISDRGQARDALIGIQRRWDEIGRVPRESLRPIEDRLRAIEAHVRKLDDDHWAGSNPERKARSEGMAGQLEDAIAALEADIEQAKGAGDAKRQAALEADLETKREWLTIVAAAG